MAESLILLPVFCTTTETGEFRRGKEISWDGYISNKETDYLIERWNSEIVP